MCKPRRGGCEGSSARPGRRLCLCWGTEPGRTGCPVGFANLPAAQQRRMGTRCRSRHVAASPQPLKVILLWESRMSAAGQMLLPRCKTQYWSMQTLQTAAGAAAGFVPSAQVTGCSFGCGHIKQTGTRGLLWRSLLQGMSPAWVSSVPSSPRGSSACLANALSFPTCLLGAVARSVPRHGCSLGTDPMAPPPPAGMPASAGRVLFSAATLCPVPFLKGQGKFSNRETSLIFLAVPFTVSDPIPIIPWSPKASSCHLHAVFLCRLFFIRALGERRTEEVHEPQQTTAPFYFPCCRVLYRAHRGLIKSRSPRNVSAFCISNTTFLHIMGNTKLERIFAMC